MGIAERGAMAESVGAISKESAEEYYKKFRAGSELKLTQEIDVWREMIQNDPPRMHICSDSIDVATDELDQHTITTLLWGHICAYLEAETLNRAAILLHRGISGHEAVTDLRSWVEQLCNSAQKYKWEPALRSVGVEDLSLNWPQQEISIELTSPYERAFWEAETDPDAVIDLWNAAGWWEAYVRELPAKTARRPIAAHGNLPNDDRSRARSKWLDTHELNTGLSDLDVAKSGGPSFNTIKRWRKGVISTRGLYVRHQLAKVFDCKPDEVPE